MSDSENKLDVGLDRILVCAAIRLVNEQSFRALERFPGTELTFRSSTRSFIHAHRKDSKISIQPRASC